MGRRLISNEARDEILTVVDLTAEFPEPVILRNAPHDISAPILDASSLSARHTVELVGQISQLRRPVFIHLAQSHRRTGLVAAALLVSMGLVTYVEDAMQTLQNVRAGICLNRAQRRVLSETVSLMFGER